MQQRHYTYKTNQRAVHASASGPALQIDARVAVIARHDNRHRSDPGFAGRVGTVLRVMHTAGTETEVLVALDSAVFGGRRREWLWSSEVDVV